MGMRPQDLRKMMEQAQQLQEQMSRAQEELAEETYEATAGGGAIRAVVTGRGELVEVHISPEVIDPDDPEMLGDLVVAAVNQAIQAANEAAGSRFGGLMGGMDLPPGLLG